MSIQTKCPNCGAIYRNVSTDKLGKSAHCQKCNQNFVVQAFNTNTKPAFIVPVCPECGTRYKKGPASLLGKSTRCPKCGATFIIKAEAAPAVSSRFNTDAPAEWQIGDTILNLYEIKEVLGVGGMGKVYRVYHKHWRIDLAVKSPLPKLMSSPHAVENFEREASTWVNMGMFPHIVSCYYVRTLGGIPRIFVECVEGGSLLDWIKKGKLYEGGSEKALERILDIAIQFAWGLDFSHEKGLIHQDVKPANVMMSQDGTAKVTDFGLANAINISTENRASVEQSDSQATLIATYGGMTPAYCSPEQAGLQAKRMAGKIQKKQLPKLDRRTDIWSWAVSVLEMFTGEVTWSMGNVANESLMMYLEEGPEDDSLPQMPESVAEVLKRCLQHAPADRPHDMKEVAQMLVGLYQPVTGYVYPRDPPKASEYLADAFNNQAVSLWELGRQTEAMGYFKQAIETDPTHLQAVYNHAMLQWRAAEIEGTELLMRLANCGNNPTVDQEALAELTAYIHAESLDKESVKGALAAFEGKYEAIFSQVKIAEIKCRNTLEGHTGHVNSVAVTPSGRYVLSGSSDKTIKVWELDTVQCFRTLEGYQNEITSVAVSPDGLYAFSGSSENTIKKWKFDTGQYRNTLDGHSGRVTSVAVSPDSRCVLSGSWDNTIKVWELDTGQCLRTLEGHTDRVNSIAVCPAGRYVLSGSVDSTIRVWNFETGQCIRTLKGHTKSINAVAVSFKGRYALSGGADRTIKVWKFDTGQCFRTLVGHTDSVNSVAVSFDGRYALSGSADDTVRVWELDTGQCLRSLVGHTDSVNYVALSPDSLYAMSGSADNTIKVWEDISSASQRFRADLQLTQPKGAEIIKKEQDAINQAVLKAEAFYQKGNFRRAYSVLLTAWKALSFTANELILRNYAKLKNKGRNSHLIFFYRMKTLVRHTGRVNAVAVSPDGRYIFSVSKDSTIGVWAVDTGKCLRILEGHTGCVNSVAVGADGRYVLSGGEDNSIKVWAVHTGKCIRTLVGHTESVNSVAVSSDGRYVLSGSDDNSIKVWALDSGQCLRTLEEHSGRINSVAVCPDGRYVVSGSDDSTIKLWAIDTGQCLRTLKGHTGYVNSVAVSPDGGYVLSGSDDSTIRVWDISTGQCLRILEGHSDRVNSVAVSPDGQHILSASVDSTIKVWGLETGQYLRSLVGHIGRVNSVVVSPDGLYVISGSSDHSLIIWRLIWDIRFPDAVGWDNRVLPFLEIFLELHQGKWTEDDWQTLVTELQARGLGWILAVGIRKKLVDLTQKYAIDGQLWLRERYGRVIACPRCHRNVVNECSGCGIKVDSYINALNCDNSAKKTGQRALDLIVDFNKVWDHSARFVDLSKNKNLENIFFNVAVVMLILVGIVSHWYWGLLVGEIISGLGLFWIVYDRGVKTAKAVRQFLPTIRKQLAKDNIGFVAAVLIFWVKESPKIEFVRPILQKKLEYLWNLNKLNKAAKHKQFHFFKKSLERFKEAMNSQVLTVKAIENYDKVLQSNQKNPEAWYNRGNALAQLGRHEEAIKSFEKALLFKTDYEKAWYSRGNALAQLGRCDAAIESYDKALLFKGDDSVVWNNRGLALRNLGRYEEAVETYDKALQFKPNDSVAWNNRGVALRNLGRYEEAIESFDKALQFKPNDNVAWNSRGIALAQLGQHEEAIKSYDMALHFKHDLNEALNNRGIALRNLGRYEEAIKSFDRALQLKPNDREAWNNRCIALGELGRREEAIES